MFGKEQDVAERTLASRLRLATVRLREEYGGQDVILCAADIPLPQPDVRAEPS